MNLYIINGIITIIIAISVKAIKDKQKRKKVFLICTFIQLFLFLALRATDVGIDLKNYFLLYDQCKLYKLSSILSVDYEKGYILYTYIVAKFINNKQFFLIITAFITLIGEFYAIKKYSKNYFLSIFVFITFQFYIYNFYLLRQSIALSILMISLTFVEKRKIVPFIILVILATCFHTSAILFIIIYFIANIKIDNKKLLVILGTVIGITIFGSSIINIIFKYLYSNYELTGSNGGMTYLLLLIMTLFIATLVKKELLNENNKNNILWYNMLIISVLIQTLAIKVAIISRLNNYYTFSLIFILPNVLETFKDKKIKTIGQILIMFFLSIFFIINLSNTIIYQPYHFFWS